MILKNGTEVRHTTPQLHVPFADYDAVRQENKRLREALAEFGAHRENCGKVVWGDFAQPCTCGFDAVRMDAGAARG